MTEGEKINYTLEMIGGYDEQGYLLDRKGDKIDLARAANLRKFPRPSDGAVVDCIGFDDAEALSLAGRLSGIDGYEGGYYPVGEVLVVLGRSPQFSRAQASALEAAVGAGERFIPFKHEQEGRTVYFLGLDMTKADVVKDYLGNSQDADNATVDAVCSILDTNLKRYLLQREQETWQQRLAKGTTSEKNDRKYLRARGINTEGIDVKIFSFTAFDDKNDYERINGFANALQTDLPDRYQTYTDEFIVKVYRDLSQAAGEWVRAFNIAADEIITGASGDRRELIFGEKDAIKQREDGRKNAERSHVVRLRNNVYANESELSIHSGGFDYQAGSNRANTRAKPILEQLVDGDELTGVFTKENQVLRTTDDIADQEGYQRRGFILSDEADDRVYTRTPEEIKAETGVARIFEILGSKLRQAGAARGLRTTTISIEPVLDALKAQLVYTGTIIHENWVRKQFEEKAELIYNMLDSVDAKIAKYEARYENVVKGVNDKGVTISQEDVRKEAEQVRNGLIGSYKRKDHNAVKGTSYQFGIIGVLSNATRARMQKKAKTVLSAERFGKLQKLDEIIARGASDGN